MCFFLMSFLITLSFFGLRLLGYTYVIAKACGQR